MECLREHAGCKNAARSAMITTLQASGFICNAFASGRHYTDSVYDALGQDQQQKNTWEGASLGKRCGGDRAPQLHFVETLRKLMSGRRVNHKQSWRPLRRQQSTHVAIFLNPNFTVIGAMCAWFSSPPYYEMCDFEPNKN